MSNEAAIELIDNELQHVRDNETRLNKRIATIHYDQNILAKKLIDAVSTLSTVSAYTTVKRKIDPLVALFKRVNHLVETSQHVAAQYEEWADSLRRSLGEFEASRQRARRRIRDILDIDMLLPAIKLGEDIFTDDQILNRIRSTPDYLERIELRLTAAEEAVRRMRDAGRELTRTIKKEAEDL